MRLISIVLSFLIAGCVSTDPSRDLSSTQNQQLLGSRDSVQRQKLLVGTKKISRSKGIGTTGEKTAAASDAVAVFLPGQKTKYTEKPSRTFNIKSKKDTAELAALLMYVDGRRTHLDMAINADLKLRVQSVQSRKERTFVKLEQYVERKVNGATYIVPIVGSNVVVSIKNNEVVSMQSAITNPPTISFVLNNPGFDLSQLSEKELELMRTQMVKYGKTELVRKYFANVAANTGQTFDFDSWLKANPAEQMERVKKFFAGIKKTSTAKMLIDLARMQRLSFVKRGNEWNFHILKPFGLAIEFELQIPKNQASRLLVKNVRDLRKEVSIEVYAAPDYPQTGPRISFDDEIRTGIQIDNVTALFQDVLGYYRDRMGWFGPNGADSKYKVIAFKGIQTDAVQNAFFQGHMEPQHFGIGAGGSQLFNFDNSVGVMGHEYGHAIIHHTSGLVYAGESGALNEHFADVQGATLEASVTGGEYPYSIGHDVVTPAAAAPKQLILGLILKAAGIPQADIQRFNLDKVALRNLMEPSLSLNAQPATVQAGKEMFGENCQPSADNDSCGVHYLSGIPNRATSLIIDALGVDATRSLFFNTGVNRLGMFSNFSEYLRQLIEECSEGGELQTHECNLILDAFNSVGVEYPTGDNNHQPEPLPDDNQPPTEPQKPSSPPLMMCGWISVSATNNITIIDNKFDTVVLNSANANKFGGNFTDIRANDFTSLLPHKSCGCATGQISQTPNSKNVWFNYFLNVNPGSIVKKKTTACSGIVFK